MVHAGKYRTEDKLKTDTTKLNTTQIKQTTYNTARESVALLVAHRTNDRKVVGSRPTKVVFITVLTGNRLG